MPQALVPVFTSLGLGATGAAIAANLTASVIMSLVSNLLAPRPKFEEQDRELQVPTSLPSERFVYGRARAPATPWAAVEPQRTLYAAYLLNSRPSEGNFTVFMDNREVEISGDIYDFATGASATNAPFNGLLKMWIGRGDQDGPPAQIMAEIGDPTSADPERFWPTDELRDLTVLWLRADRGNARTVGERWPRWPPEVHVHGDWSKVWDMRDPAQDPDDPDTWAWSDNQALCLLDALRRNPVREWPLRQIDLGLFQDAADLADEAVPFKAGGDAPRYRVGGVVPFSGRELHDMIRPLEEAGGGMLMRRGGRVGYVPGAYVLPSMDVGPMVLSDAPLEFRRLAAGSELPRAVRATYPDPAAGWEVSELPDVPVPGGARPDGGDDGVETVEYTLVPYPAQVARLAQARARQHGKQRRISCVLEPRAFAAVAGATVGFTVPRAGDKRSGIYQLVETHPAEWLDQQEGVAMRLPVSMRETGPDVWEWVPATDEPDFIAQPVPGIGSPGSVDGLDIAPPEMLTATAGPDFIDVELRTPNSSDFAGVELWAGTSDDPDAMSLVVGPVWGAANETFTLRETGLVPEVTRHYRALSVASNAGRTALSNSTVSATTDPISP